MVRMSLVSSQTKSESDGETNMVLLVVGFVVAVAITVGAAAKQTLCKNQIAPKIDESLYGTGGEPGLQLSDFTSPM